MGFLNRPIAEHGKEWKYRSSMSSWTRNEGTGSSSHVFGAAAMMRFHSSKLIISLRTERRASVTENSGGGAVVKLLAHRCRVSKCLQMKALSLFGESITILATGIKDKMHETRT